MMADEETKLIQDRDIIDMTKHNMLQDKKREIEYTNLSKDYISFLKDEIIYQNKFIFDHLNTVYKHEYKETRCSQGIQVKSPKDIVNVNHVCIIKCLLQTTSYNHLLLLHLLIPRKEKLNQQQARNPP